MPCSGWSATPQPSITLDVYGELWDDSQEQLATKLDEAIRAEMVA